MEENNQTTPQEPVASEKKTKKFDFKKLIIPALIVLLAASIVVGYLCYTGKLSGDVLSKEQAGETAINFINEKLLSGQGTTASLIEATKESSLYKIKIKISDQEYDTYISGDGKVFFPSGVSMIEEEEATTSKTTTIGNFTVSSDDLCLENNKPIVYFFGMQTCPHCQWEHPIMQAVAAKFGNLISFKDHMDSSADSDVFSKYSDGSVPLTVIGCKYYRIGSGEAEGTEQETKNLTALICKLTGNQPGAVCDEVSDLVDQIDG